MEAIQLRPRKATEIVDASIEVYRRNPIHFILLTSIVHVPWLILQIVFVGEAQDFEAMLNSFLISLGTLATYFIMSGLIVHMASELYLGREVDAFETVRRTWRKLPAVFLASLMQAFGIGIGLILFLFPAVYLSAVLFAVVPSIVLEDRGLFDAFQRSADLSRDMKGHILGTLGVVVLIRFIVQISTLLLVTLIPTAALKQVALAASAILIYPIIGIAEALLYYDIRIRKEGFDIEMLAAQTSPAATASV